MTKKIAVIPAYNEARHIAKVIKATKEYVDLVIVIDDGSTDKTSFEARDSDIFAKHIVNLGKGASLRTGFELAIANKADIIITIDADDQNNPDDIPRLINALIESKADIVIGARSLNKNMPLIYRIGNIGLRKIFQFLFKLRINDTQSGFRAIRAQVYKKIIWQSNNYAVEAEMLANAGKYRLKCVEIPISTKYLDSYKGTTILDGISIFFQMLLWKFKS